MNHLSPKTAALLDLPDAERQAAVLAEKWVHYSLAKDTLARMEALLVHPPTHRMPNMLLVGDTNNGKTALLRRFAAAHPPVQQESDGRLTWPVVYIQAPPEPDEKRFYNLLFDKVDAPYKLTDRLDKKQVQVVHILRHLQVKVLVIDEIQHILAGSQAKQRIFLNVLKYLSNELMIPLICAGVRTAFNAVQSDEQLANRFEPAVLSKWSPGEEYRRLLLSFERQLPLRKPSGLAEDYNLGMKLLSMSEGTIGELAKILKLATIQAIETKAEQITQPLLARLRYTAPSDRMKLPKYS
jgi:hypothetical protein